MPDTNTMAEKSGKVGPTVEISKSTDTPATPGSYAEFMGSETKQSENSYTASRRDLLVGTLGSKDTVKG
jgi:hypothetical protein